ncbi:MAG: hypothetical protein CMM00_02255 [Rhodopirellula sp.]|jgi:hypothetical protein|nr:hypothetical protein [Rhodopirellula sp.]
MRIIINEVKQHAKNAFAVANFVGDASGFFTKTCCGIQRSAYSYAHVLTIVFVCKVDEDHRSGWNRSPLIVVEPWPVTCNQL